MSQYITESTMYVVEGQEEVTLTCDFWPSISTVFYVDGKQVKDYQEGAHNIIT